MTNPNSEPPSPCLHCSRYLVGQDRNNRWVVRDREGLCGGLFISKHEAMRYALLETGNRPEHVIVVSEPIEIEMTASMQAV